MPSNARARSVAHDLAREPCVAKEFHHRRIMGLRTPATNLSDWHKVDHTLAQRPAHTYRENCGRNAMMTRLSTVDPGLAKWPQPTRPSPSWDAKPTGGPHGRGGTGPEEGVARSVDQSSTMGATGAARRRDAAFWHQLAPAVAIFVQTRALRVPAELRATHPLGLRAPLSGPRGRPSRDRPQSWPPPHVLLIPLRTVKTHNARQDPRRGQPRIAPGRPPAA